FGPQQVFSILIDRRIRYARFREALSPQLTRVASSARSTECVRIITTQGKSIIHSKPHTGADDVRLSHSKERGTHAELSPTFNGGLGCEVRHSLERLQVFRPAIRVSRVVEDIGPNDNVERTYGLCKSQCEPQKHRVACGHICDRDSLADFLGSAIF